MTPAEAFRKYGSLRSWQTGATVDGIGFTLGHGSWPVYDASATTSTRRLVRNPPLLDESARWTGAWAPRTLTGFWPIDFFTGISEANKEIVIPWNVGWKTPGGTQAQSADNGVIVDGGTVRWELQGMAPAGDRWRVDACHRITPGTVVRGSQGPWSKLDGLFRPSWLSGPWPGPVRLVGFNVQWGLGATAVKGAWVEHPGRTQPYALPLGLPEGNSDRMLPCGQVLRHVITEGEIEQWLIAEGVRLDSALAVSKRWAAIGLRDHGMRLSESGTGDPIIESSGGCNPVDLAAWKARGINTETDANNLFRNIFKYGRLEAA